MQMINFMCIHIFFSFFKFRVGYKSLPGRGALGRGSGDGRKDFVYVVAGYSHGEGGGERSI